MHPAEPDSIWDVDEVAAYLKTPKQTLYRWRIEGIGPPAKKVGQHLRYRSNLVIAWFDDLEDSQRDF